MAGRSEALLRQALTKAGVEIPADINLELAKYLKNRGVEALELHARTKSSRTPSAFRSN